MTQPHDRRYRERHFVNPSHNLVSHVMEVPADIRRVETSEPCTFCGVARGCRHRPWMLAQ